MNSRILPALALIIAVATFFLYVSPTWNGSIAATKAAIASDNQALAAATDFQNRENQLAAERDAMDPVGRASLQAMLPDSVDNVGIILNLNALAARSGLSLTNIDVATAATNSAGTSTAGASGVGSALAAAQNAVGSVDLMLTAAGTYTSLAHFLTGMEGSARLLDLRDLSVKGSSTGVYTYEMTIRLYWLR